MNNKFKYHLFLFLSTFSRGLIEVFSLIILYKKGLSIHQLLLFLLLTYIIGILASIVSLKFNKKIILIVSNILYGLSYLYLSKINITISSLIILACFLSISNYSYHILRHYYALNMLEDKNKTSIIVILIYIATSTSSLIGSLLLEYSYLITSIIVLLLSLLSIIPILRYNPINNKKESIKIIYLNKNKLFFSILEQSKVILTELQPLFLYIYIQNSYKYIGLFNILMHISSLMFIYILSKHLTIKKFKYIAISLSIILIFKINIKNKIILLFIALAEGIFLKTYEIFSLKNLYSITNNNISSYLFTEELIFLLTKSIFILFCLILNLKLKTILYIGILGITISSFFIENKKNFKN